jgi:hypothetical protein
VFQSSPGPKAECDAADGRFVRAVGAGRLDGLLQVLADDVTMWVAGGGRARGAAIRPLHGRRAVARSVLASTRYLPAPITP